MFHLHVCRISSTQRTFQLYPGHEEVNKVTMQPPMFADFAGNVLKYDHPMILSAHQPHVLFPPVLRLSPAAAGVHPQTGRHLPSPVQLPFVGLGHNLVTRDLTAPLRVVAPANHHNRPPVPDLILMADVAAGHGTSSSNGPSLSWHNKQPLASKGHGKNDEKLGNGWSLGPIDYRC